MKRRIFVETTPAFSTEVELLLEELQRILHTTTLSELRIIQVYDLFRLKAEESQEVLSVLRQPKRDQLLLEEDLLPLLNHQPNFCIENFPGQFDQRAYSAEMTFKVMGLSEETKISTAVLYLFNTDLDEQEFQKIQSYLFNPINTRLKDLSLPINDSRFIDTREPKAVPVFNDFIHMTESKLVEFRLKHGLAMEFEDLLHIQQYFRDVEGRNPTETEILVLDTYWSDHCRHTTFETELLNIDFKESQFKEQLQEAYESYLDLRRATKITDRPETLMDMGTVFGRYQRKTGELADMEVSDEVNACSIRIDVDVDGKKEPWLLMFKNETHNHPTEIEPFGGASTCVGGAIRDPLSGRAYVYQAMRIGGAGDVLAPVEETLEGKLPQRKISRVSAAGNSSYGNQIGATTTYAKEYYHPGFVAKRMEVGAVVGAVPEAQVVREAPTPGDLIIMLGGRTGRDGVGGATGSSQVQTVESIETAGSEVQKGCPTEERKILRLFRKAEVTTMIKKSNDFGAGGVSVAIGELADGVEVNLDVVPVKYAGLNGTELAISESQERMAVVVAKEDAENFIKLAEAESVEAVIVAKVTETPRLVIRWQGEKIVDIARSFLDTNGIRKRVTAKVVDSNKPSPLMMRKSLEDIEKAWQATLAEYNNASQKGMQSLFDSTLGRSTVLAPYGGKCQATPAEASVQKIQVEKGFTETATILAHGYNPYIGEWSPFHGAAYAVIEALARIVATGGDWQKARMSFQEYFERLDNIPERFGKPVAALLGSIDAQKAFNVPSIGGKDSMSGSFNDLHVPPTLIAFAVSPVNCQAVLSPEFKESGEYIYLLPVKEDPTSKIDYSAIIENFNTFKEIQQNHGITAAISVRQGGVAKALGVMSFGNRIGANIENISAHDLFRPQYGAFVITTRQPLPESDRYIPLGTTLSEYRFDFGNLTILGDTLQAAFEDRFEPLFPTQFKESGSAVEIPEQPLRESVTYRGSLAKGEKPLAYIPVFDGTHSEYDTAKAFEAAGAKVIQRPFRDLTPSAVESSEKEMVELLEKAQIFVLTGGFASTDEAAGTGTMVSRILERPVITKAVEAFIAKGGLILGLNAGFHALVKTGLLPYGEFREESEAHLVLNRAGQHLSQMVTTKVVNNSSPWFKSEKIGAEHRLPFSALEGRLMLSASLFEALMINGQIATQYVDHKGRATVNLEFNPAGSSFAIESLTSPNGQIYGKMAQSDRYEEGLLKNIPGNRKQNIFEDAVAYFQVEK